MKKLIPIFIALLICTSCGEDFFETTLKVDPPPHEDQMVLHSFIKTNDSLLLFSVSKSRGILETINTFGAEYINDATIEIYEDGVLKYTPTILEEQPFNYSVVLDGPFGGTGKSYEVKATHSTLGSVSATQKMPEAPILVSAIFDEDGGFSVDFDERANAIDITINDPVGNNYYEVIVLREEENGGGTNIRRVRTETLDVNASDGLGGFHLLDDISFDGQEYTFQVETDRDWNETMFVSVKAITSDWYLYSKSMYSFSGSGDFELFSEPVTVHTNIENGLGVFALGAEAQIPVEEE